jgi:hypothetical protein
MQTDLTDQIREYVETAAPAISLAELAQLAERRPGLGAAAQRHAGSSARLYFGMPRAVTAGVIAVAVAAAAAAVTITLATGDGATPGQRSHNAIGGATAKAHISAPGPAASGAPAAASISLTAKFLHHAAAIVRTQPGTPPGPEQYVYAETMAQGGGLYQIWQSADGSRPGLVATPKGDGQGYFKLSSCTVAQGEKYLQGGCSEQAGYLPQMPVQPAALRTFLIRIGMMPTQAQAAANASTPGWEANDLGKNVDALMMNTYLLPAQRAALFDLIAQIPGFTIVPGVRDVLGQVGVGIQWTYFGFSTGIILNPVTYAYLGDNSGRVGDVRPWRALVHFGYVDSLPAHKLTH